MMMPKKALKESLLANLVWFQNSGVMVPNDGFWGVAERIALKGNNTMEEIYRVMPAWTECRGYSVIEQRRPDCNFQTALLFLLSAEVLKNKTYRKIGENILDFLYCRSGTLYRFPPDPRMCGSWFWSHISKGIWLDDNSWCCAIALMIAEKYPKLDQKYAMQKWGLLTADSLVEGFRSNFGKAERGNPLWDGNLNLPHWGALVCMAMAKAYQVSPKKTYKKVAVDYYKYLNEHKDEFIASELSYAMIGCNFCFAAFEDERFLRLAKFFGNKLIRRMDPVTGNLPAEHGESPIGPHLADTIYTINWAMVGFQSLHAVNCDGQYREAFEKLLSLVIRIQDKSTKKHLKGCWRGMFDLKANTWGGGDCYEGGANSIYTGWTNAPISLCIAYELAGGALIKGLR